MKIYGLYVSFNLSSVGKITKTWLIFYELILQFETPSSTSACGP